VQRLSLGSNIFVTIGVTTCAWLDWIVCSLHTFRLLSFKIRNILCPFNAQTFSSVKTALHSSKFCYQVCLCEDKSSCFCNNVILMKEHQACGDVQNHEVITFFVFEIGYKFSFLIRSFTRDSLQRWPFLNGTRQAEYEFIVCFALRILVGESELVNGSDFCHLYLFELSSNVYHWFAVSCQKLTSFRYYAARISARNPDVKAFPVPYT
jgi:hypothetical protein